MERNIRTFQNMLAKYITEQNTDEFLPFTTFYYNTAVHEMTAESSYISLCPYFLVEIIIILHMCYHSLRSM